MRLAIADVLYATAATGATGALVLYAMPARLMQLAIKRRNRCNRRRAEYPSQGTAQRWGYCMRHIAGYCMFLLRAIACDFPVLRCVCPPRGSRSPVSESRIRVQDPSLVSESSIRVRVPSSRLAESVSACPCLASCRCNICLFVPFCLSVPCQCLSACLCPCFVCALPVTFKSLVRSLLKWRAPFAAERRGHREAAS